MNKAPLRDVGGHKCCLVLLLLDNVLRHSSLDLTNLRLGQTTAKVILQHDCLSTAGHLLDCHWQCHMFCRFDTTFGDRVNPVLR